MDLSKIRKAAKQPLNALWIALIVDTYFSDIAYPLLLMDSILDLFYSHYGFQDMI